jgi:hypothetical protein
MTLHENRSPREYDSVGFFGREDIVRYIIENLADPQADQRRRRAILVEGPASRGKTWLLHRVHEQIQANYANQIAVCFFAGGDFHANDRWASRSEQLLRRLLIRLWDVVHHYCPTLPWPTDIMPEHDVERFDKIAQLLQGSQPQTLLQLITEKIDEAALPALLIILDGMEEIDADVLKMFEFEFVNELFRNPRVRLLASRRVNNTTHQWRKPFIKQQNNILSLDPFDSPEQQITYLIRAKGAQITFQELKDQMQHYTWLNPGANAFLVDCAIDRATKITSECVQECLTILMQSVREASPINGSEFEYIRRMATLFPEIALQGVARHKLNDVFDHMSDRNRDEFLGQLQGRGIGFFGNSGNYILHSDFVELFCEL